MWQRKNNYGYQMWNISHMSLTFILDLVILKGEYAKNKDAVSRHSRIIILTDTHSHRDASEIITLLTIMVSNKDRRYNKWRNDNMSQNRL